MRLRSPLLLFLLLATASPLHPAVIRVPADHRTVEEAVLAASAGDTVLISEGIHAMPDTLRIPFGLTLLGEGLREETRTGLVHGRILIEDSPDSVVIENLQIELVTTQPGIVGIESYNPRTAIRSNRFTDIVLGSDFGLTIFLRDGGVVHRNHFEAASFTSVFINGGDTTRVSYNTWGSQCAAQGQDAIFAEGSPRYIEVRNNTIAGATKQIDVSPDDDGLVFEFVNNIFSLGQFHCGGSARRDVVIHHNYLQFVTYTEMCADDTTMGAGNIIGAGMDTLFCEPSPTCEFWIHPSSPVVGAGENGETLGAWPVGCDPVPVDPWFDEDGVGPGRFVGRPSPNPTSGGVQLFAGVATTTVEVYDAAGRRVRTLAAGEPGYVHWDGRNDAGKRAGSGTYYLVLRTAEGDVKRSVRIVR